MKLRVGGLYQLKPSETFIHPYRKESNGILVYKQEKLLESVEFESGTPVLVIANINKEKFVGCLIQDKVYEVHFENLIKLS